MKEKGDIISIMAETPVLHSSEDSRWDFKVAITFKDEHTALDYGIVDPYKNYFILISQTTSRPNSTGLNYSLPIGM